MVVASELALQKSEVVASQPQPCLSIQHLILWHAQTHRSKPAKISVPSSLYTTREAHHSHASMLKVVRTPSEFTAKMLFASAPHVTPVAGTAALSGSDHSFDAFEYC
jgi:hypothetical protein